MAAGCAFGHDAPGIICAQAAHHPEPQPHRAILHRAGHLRPADACAERAHAPPAGVAHQARRWVEAHGLGVDERRQELGGVMTAQPGALVGQHGEGRRVGLGESEVGEPDELGEHRAGDLIGYAPLACPLQEPLPHAQHGVATALAAHRPAQVLGLAGAEARERHRHLQHLLLEHHHAQGLLQHRLQQGVVVRRAEGGVAAPGAAVAHIGMHGAPAHGAGADEGDLHGEVIQVLGPRLQQALHLGAALDLEHAHGVGVLDLGVHRGVVEPDARDVRCAAVPGGDEVQAVLHRREHSQPQQVDLHEPGIGAGVLVPLADLAAGERRGHHGHQFHQGGGAHDHPARVLREVAGKARGLLRQHGEGPPAARAQAIRAPGHAADLLLHRIGRRPAVRQPREALDIRRRQGECRADATDGHAGAEGGEGRHQGGMPGPVAADDLLDQPRADIAREVQVDIGNRPDVAVQEPAEEEPARHRIDVREAGEVADDRSH